MIRNRVIYKVAAHYYYSPPHGLHVWLFPVRSADAGRKAEHCGVRHVKPRVVGLGQQMLEQAAAHKAADGAAF